MLRLFVLYAGGELDLAQYGCLPPSRKVILHNRQRENKLANMDTKFY